MLGRNSRDFKRVTAGANYIIDASKMCVLLSVETASSRGLSEWQNKLPFFKDGANVHVYKSKSEFKTARVVKVGSIAFRGFGAKMQTIDFAEWK